jgi:GTP cyclohydrolase I
LKTFNYNINPKTKGGLLLNQLYDLIEKALIDKDKIKEAVKLIIEAIGEDPEREGLLETPDRIAKMYSEIFSGLNESAEDHLARTFTVEHDDIVLEKDIAFYSMCEHHFLPFFGKVHIAYIPNGRVAGLSKLARTVEVYASRPQLQERMTVQIAEALMKYLNAKGAMVIIEAEHLCMNMRGVKKPGTVTKTVAVRGIFEGNNELKQEVYNLIKD